jgi:hypothetical protein
MITRSPPPRREQPAAQPQPQSIAVKFEEGHAPNSMLNGTGTGTGVHTPSGHHPLRKSFTHTSSLSNSTSASSSRRPEDAQNDYWLKQMAAAIAERDAARAQATAIEEAKNTQIYELRQQFADERHQWKQTCDAVSTHILCHLRKCHTITMFSPDSPTAYSYRRLANTLHFNK